MKKTIRRIAFFLFVLFHLSFLLAIFYEKIDTLQLVALLLIIALLVTIGYFKSPREEEEHFFEDFYNIIYVITGCMITFLLNQMAGLGPVIGAGITGSIASFLPIIFRRKGAATKEIPVAMYCGAFVGMTSPMVTENWRFILFAGFVTGVIYICSKNVFQGYGGKLGSVAFGGVAITSVFLFLFTS
ncbi:hypothetical protein [Autumnicola musiva]|uniref:Uncharacterized protein n=1 Tax=Autumnicola musiva TaxID=3075589 RepID=A0ABU3D7K1_9FLAO|nr:hypothetical protein [Zunongwangia sp. F117]MDT0677516.1 hypothetical protein [Zunongwangia sp. F117]